MSDTHGTYGAMRKCGECKKLFFIPDLSLWVFKRYDKRKSSYKYFCSWGCFRAWEKEHPRKKKQKGLAWYE